MMYGRLKGGRVWHLRDTAIIPRAACNDRIMIEVRELPTGPLCKDCYFIREATQ